MSFGMLAGVAAACALASSFAGAQDSTATGRASATSKRANDGDIHSVHFTRLIQVYDPETQAGIAGAVVRDRITGNSVKTSSTGHVALVPGFVKAGGALLEIRMVGYEPVGPFFVDPTSDTTVLVPMSKVVASLPAMVTTDRYRIDTDRGEWAGFEQRCSVRHAACFNESDLSAHPSAKLYDFLVKADGIVPQCSVSQVKIARISPTSSAQTDKENILPSNCLAKMHKAAGPGLCTPTYFVDGHEWSPLGGYAQNQLEGPFGPTQIKGIEVYESQKPRPLRFEADALCGVIVIWTR